MTYVGRNIKTGYLGGLAGGSDTLQTTGNRGVQTEGLEEASIHVGQSSTSVAHQDLIFSAVGATDLLEALLVSLGRLEEPEGKTAENRRSSLTACSDESAGIGHQFGIAKSGGSATAPQHGVHEITTAVQTLVVHSLMDSLLGVSLLSVSGGNEIVGGEQLEELEQEGISGTGFNEGEKFESLKSERNGKVHGRVTETIERLAKGKIANDIEKSESVPHDHIDGLALASLLAETLNHEIDVTLDNRLLLTETLGRERVRHGLAHSIVVNLIRIEDIGSLGNGQDESLELVGLVVVDISPSLLGDERNLARTETHSHAVLLVKLAHLGIQNTTNMSKLSHERESNPDLGAGEFGERMEPDIVDGEKDIVNDVSNGRRLYDVDNGDSHFYCF